MPKKVNITLDVGQKVLNFDQNDPSNQKNEIQDCLDKEIQLQQVSEECVKSAVRKLSYNELQENHDPN